MEEKKVVQVTKIPVMIMTENERYQLYSNTLFTVQRKLQDMNGYFMKIGQNISYDNFKIEPLIMQYQLFDPNFDYMESQLNKCMSLYVHDGIRILRSEQEQQSFCKILKADITIMRQYKQYIIDNLGGNPELFNIFEYDKDYDRIHKLCVESEKKIQKFWSRMNETRNKMKDKN